MTNVDSIRVCVVSPLYHPSMGGLGRQAQLLTERLAEEVAGVFVIARRMRGMPDASFSSGVRVIRAWSLFPGVHNYERVSIRNILISLSFCVSCAFLLVRERRNFDIVHFHGASLPLFIGLLVLKLLGKKVVAKVAAANVGTEAGSLRGRYLGLGTIISGMLRGVDMFVATSSEIEEGLRRDGLRRIIRITNFVDLREAARAAGNSREELRNRWAAEGSSVVIFSGRFVRRKGIPFLLEAWKTVAGAVSGARLVLLGDGPLLGEMKRAVEELNISDTVYFAGHVSDVADHLRAADIFVLPSLQEGMPNALLEAMACGLPAVATKIGGVVDIVRDGENGILVEPGNPEALAEGVSRLLADSSCAERIGRAAAATISQHFSLETVAGKYLSLYRRLLVGAEGGAGNE